MNPVYSYVTEKIMDTLKQGKIPWEKPWNTSKASNLISGKPYRGINAFLLGIAPYASPYWLTFKQAQSLGGNVKKGERGSMVVFWKFFDKPEDKQSNRPPLLRYYTVFNVEQTENIPEDKMPKVEKLDFVPNEKAQAIFDGMPNKPIVEYKGSQACYIPALDSVLLPAKESFKSIGGFYSVAFHELGHSTGHEKRLSRKLVGSYDRGSYSFEELVAELTSAFLCAESGLTMSFDNSVAYVQGWLSFLSDSPEAIVKAASKAQKAADYILGKIEPQTEEVES